MRIQAGALRIEQRRVVLETTVLPLNYAPMCLTDKSRKRLTVSALPIELRGHETTARLELATSRGNMRSIRLLQCGQVRGAGLEPAPPCGTGSLVQRVFQFHHSRTRYSRRDSNSHLSELKSDASANWATRAYNGDESDNGVHTQLLYHLSYPPMWESC